MTAQYLKLGFLVFTFLAILPLRAEFLHWPKGCIHGMNARGGFCSWESLEASQQKVCENWELAVSRGTVGAFEGCRGLRLIKGTLWLVTDQSGLSISLPSGHKLVTHDVPLMVLLKASESGGHSIHVLTGTLEAIFWEERFRVLAGQSLKWNSPMEDESGWILAFQIQPVLNDSIGLPKNILPRIQLVLKNLNLKQVARHTGHQHKNQIQAAMDRQWHYWQQKESVRLKKYEEDALYREWFRIRLVDPLEWQNFLQSPDFRRRPTSD